MVIFSQHLLEVIFRAYMLGAILFIVTVGTVSLFVTSEGLLQAHSRFAYEFCFGAVQIMVWKIYFFNTKIPYDSFFSFGVRLITESGQYNLDIALGAPFRNMKCNLMPILWVLYCIGSNIVNKTF